MPPKTQTRKRTSAKRTSTSSPAPAVAKAKAKPPAAEKKANGPTIPERVGSLEARLLAVEARIGIDHEAIAADVAESTQRGADAAALAEPAEEDGE